MAITSIAVALQLLLLLYHQMTTRFDFFPFNAARFYTPFERQMEAGVNLVLMSLAPLGFGFGVKPLMIYGAAYYAILLCIECATWFAPYFYRPSPKWAEMYARMHARTILVLPARCGNPAPNLEHLILMALTIVTAVATILAYRSHPELDFQHWGFAALLGAAMVAGTLYENVFRAAPSKSDDASG